MGSDISNKTLLQSRNSNHFYHFLAANQIYNGLSLKKQSFCLFSGHPHSQGLTEMILFPPFLPNVDTRVKHFQAEEGKCAWPEESRPWPWDAEPDQGCSELGAAALALLHQNSSLGQGMGG